MKLNELVNFYKTASDDTLKEHIEQNNDTGFLAEDVVKVIRTAQDPTAWSEPMSGDQLMEMVRRIAKDAENARR